MRKPHTPASAQHATELNMDFRHRVVAETARRDWIASPSSKVWRKPLEREAAEHGQATSIVRFEAGSDFARREQPLGEEILVLSGEFKDEFGSYPSGTSLRNPHMSRHYPFVDGQTVIWVKVGHLPI